MSHTNQPSPSEQRAPSGFRTSEGTRQSYIRQLRERGLWREALRYEYESREPVRAITHVPYTNGPAPVDPAAKAEFVQILDDEGLQQGIENASGLHDELLSEPYDPVPLENARIVLGLMKREQGKRDSSRELVGAPG